jgi:hypothetical protein
MNWKLLTKPTGHDENKTSTLPEIKQCTITFENDYCLIKVSERIVIMADMRHNKLTVYRGQKVITVHDLDCDFTAKTLIKLIKTAQNDAYSLNKFAHE